MRESSIENIKKHLATLKLKDIAGILDEELSRAAKESIPHSELLERLFSFEAQALVERRIERRIKESKLPEMKLFTDFDFDFQPKLDKSQVLELATLGFVNRKEGIIIAGNSGTGKSYIAKAILLLGCKELYRCRYVCASDMLKDLMSGLPDDTMDQKLKKYLSPDILVIDEVGFDRLEQESARNASLFFKVINGRYCVNSTIITTNVDFGELGDYLGDPVITTAIVDRMVHHSTILTIEGPSYRIHESEKINKCPKKSGSKRAKESNKSKKK